MVRVKSCRPTLISFSFGLSVLPLRRSANRFSIMTEELRFPGLRPSLLFVKTDNWLTISATTIWSFNAVTFKSLTLVNRKSPYSWNRFKSYNRSSDKDLLF